MSQRDVYMDAVRASDTAANLCIKQIKRTTYELIKINDILINIIKAKNPKSQDIKYLSTTYGNQVKELDDKLDSGINEEQFDSEFKSITKQFNDIVKLFSSKVLPIIDRNEATAVNKAIRKLPDSIVSSYTAISNYAGNTAKEVKEAGKLIIENESKKAVHESYYYDDYYGRYLLLENDDEAPASATGGIGNSKGANNLKSGLYNWGSGLLSGMSSAAKGLVNAIFLNTGNLEKSITGNYVKTDKDGNVKEEIVISDAERGSENDNSLLGVLSRLKAKASEIGTASDNNGSTTTAIKDFFISKEFAQVTGGIILLTGAFMLVRNIYRRVKRFFGGGRGYY